MILGVNIICEKASIASVSGAGGGGGGSGGTLSPFSRGFKGWSSLRKFLGSKEHLDWLKIDLNAAKIITVQDNKGTKN